MTVQFSPQDRSNINVVASSIAEKMIKIQTLNEDIKEEAKGIADKYKGEITAAEVKALARLHNKRNERDILEEKSQKIYELYDLIMDKE